MRNLPIRLSLIALLFAFSACKKDLNPVLPGDEEAIGMNFYPATDVLFSSTGNYAGIYVDKYIADPVWGGSNPVTPFFYKSSVSGATIQGFPIFSYTGSQSNIETYVSYKAGSHRLIFSDAANAILLDTLINPSSHSYNCIYLADMLTADNALANYTMVAVEEELEEVPDGKVGVRFIHLSPDAGDLTVGLEQADGTERGLLPGAVHFLEVTPYQYVDAIANAGGLLRFSLTNSTNGASAVTGVPFKPGRRYVVVISGFLNDQRRQVRTSNGTMTSVKITNNLRATIRQIY